MTPITCLETAERLLRNYAIDPQTKELVDNLDIFIVPSVNPDGSHYSLYDNNNQRRNMVNRCLPDTFQDPLARHFMGVDLNRNNSVGSAFDGYVGAALVNPANPATFNQCTSDVFAGPCEVSEAEIKNEQWVADTFPNIKFAINIHTYGGYFMWAPGAYKPLNRETLPAPNIGIERYFFDVADTILARIKEHRNTIDRARADRPDRRRPVLGGRQLGRRPVLPQGHHLLLVRGRLADLRRQPADGRDHAHGRRRRRLRRLPAGRSRPRAGTRRSSSPTATSACSRARSQYSRDITPPLIDLDSDGVTKATAPPINFRFTWPGEAAVIHYTTDGSTPTLASPTYETQGRGAGPGAQPRPARHPRRQVDRGRHEGQRLARPDPAVPDRAGGGRSAGRCRRRCGSRSARRRRSGRSPRASRATYTATTTANVISTAGDATLRVADPSTNNTGHAGQRRVLAAAAAAGQGERRGVAPVGGATRDAADLQRAGPNDAVTIDVQAAIGADGRAAHRHATARR